MAAPENVKPNSAGADAGKAQGRSTAPSGGAPSPGDRTALKPATGKDAKKGKGHLGIIGAALVAGGLAWAVYTYVTAVDPDAKKAPTPARNIPVPKKP